MPNFIKKKKELNNFRVEVYFPQIDILKTLAIISVILLHSLPSNILKMSFSQFHISQAVPILFILLGLTSGIYFAKKEAKSQKIYNREYLFNRFKRIIIPFFLIFIISLIAGITLLGDYYIGWLSLLGYLPIPGPGNYFFSILLQFIFIAPLLFIIYKKSPKFMLIILFLCDIIFQLISPFILIFNEIPYLYSACILRYFSAISLGLYIHDELLNYSYIDIYSKRNLFILLYLPISIVYLFLSNFIGQPFPLFSDKWGFQNVISFFYPLILVIIVLNIRAFKFENDRIFFKIFILIGQASYHIFLIQMIFFSFNLSFVNLFLNLNIFNNFLMQILIGTLTNIIITITLGILFYYSL